LPPAFAQNLLEYGVLGSLVDGLHSAFFAVRNWMSQSPGQMWMVIACIGIAALLIGRRPR
jgi:hypothetical protein